MAASPEKVAEALRVAVKEAQELRRRNRELLAAAGEPVAIVGLSCRLPGAGSPAELWQLLDDGRDALSLFPGDRGWDPERLYHPDPDHPGTTYVREAGFLSDAGDFDAELFGLTPREALAMDPQQRLFLEVCWEALEDAYVDPLSLRGSQTGVYAGVMYQDYPSDPRFAGSATVTSNTGSIVSGRVAYLLGLVGPTMTVDTACSSSLVALHLACTALRNRECSLALAGGVTVMGQPSLFVGFSAQRGLARDGRCKSFADAADGTNWAEGVGVLALQRLSDARAAGRRVLALVRGSAVNQDGASNGFASPNGPSQQRVIAHALRNAGLAPADVDAVEAHGTGTTLGDPIEAQALLATYGADRPGGRPLLLGSVKSNIAHAQAAAGVAGVIKVVQSLRHETLPRTLHVDRPTGQVDWTSGAVRLLTEEHPWPLGERTRRAGVSSFGISGTNAHVILEEAPRTEGARDEQPSGRARTSPEGGADRGRRRESSPLVWVLSGHNSAALPAQAQRLRAHLEARPELQPADVALTLATGRAQLACRAAVVGADRVQLLERLARLAAGEPAAGVFRADARAGATAFMFTGQGAQRAGMGAELRRELPRFAEALEEVLAELDRHLEHPLAESLFAQAATPQAELLDRTDLAQGALFAVEVALFELLRSFGLQPDLLIGHSIGEVAAAHVAGVLSLQDACALVAARGTLMASLPAGGGMLAVEASEQELTATAEATESVSLAAVNGPRSLVLSGPLEALEEYEREWRERGRKTSRLRVSHAFHSQLIEPMLDDFRLVLNGLRFQPCLIPIVSNVTGAIASTSELGDPDYWVRHARGTVRFAEGVQALSAAGVTRYLEVGPDGVLTAAARECLDEQQRERSLFAAPLRARRSELETLAELLAQAHVAGASVDWGALLADRGASAADLPTYAFQRRRYWHDWRSSSGELPADGGATPIEHPLLGAALPLADGRGWTFLGSISPSSQRWLADHAIFQTPLLPGAALVELALVAGRELGCELLEELTLQAPLALGRDTDTQIQLHVGDADVSGRRSVAVHSRLRSAGDDAAGEEVVGERDGEDRGGWSCNARGTLAPVAPQEGAGDPLARRLQAEAWPPAGARELDTGSFYERLVGAGIEYGPAFQGVVAAWRREDELFAEVALEAEQAERADGFGVHPALLDAALHAAALDADRAGEQAALVPFSFSDVRLRRVGATSLRVAISPAGEGRLAFAAFDEDGAPVLTVGSLAARSLDADALRRMRGEQAPLYGVAWTPLAPAAGDHGESPAGSSAAGSGAGPDETVAEGSAVAQLGSCDTALEALGELVEQLDAGAPAPELAVVSIVPDEASDGPIAAAHAAARAVLALLQAWLGEQRLAHTLLVVLTRGAAAVGPGELPAPAAAAAAGVVRSAQSEHPGRLALIDLDPEADDAQPSSLPDLLASGEPQLAIRAGTPHAPRLTKVAIEQGERSPRLDPDGTVLITGGTGGLGSLLAVHMARTWGARRMLLLSRRGEHAEGAAELAAELAGLGCDARIVGCDVADRDALADALGTIAPEHPLTAVVHAAGVVEDATIEALDPERLERVMHAKVDAAVHLHELTAQVAPERFVLFSSAASVVGSPGQAAYAAANAFLDALAQRRHALGLPGTSLAWGMWAEDVGMVGALGAPERARLRRLGVQPLSVEQGLGLFDAALGAPSQDADALLVPARLDADALRALAGVGALPPLLSGLVRLPPRRATTGAGTPLRRRLAELPEEERDGAVLELVRERLAAVLGHSSGEAIDPDASFQELGVDSLAAVELRNALDAATGLRLPATLVFDHPTPAAAARMLRARIEGPRPDARGGPSALVAPRRTPATEEVAIVGMSCRYPGGVQSPADLWRLLSDGGDAVSGFPVDRGWDLERLYDPEPGRIGTSYVNEGGFLYDAGEFDAGFFRLGPSEAAAMDPQQRLLLEAAWEAFESAGIDPSSLRGSQTGVYAGAMYQDYGLAGGLELSHAYAGGTMPGAGASMISGRIAFQLGLEGPAMTVDTACSSSLVTLHLACQALRAGECSLALAAGVTVLSTPTAFIAFSGVRGLARDGRCKSFAAGADGVGWSEGVGALALERLSDAQRLGHPVLALVRGSAINQDGASNGFSAPNGPSQERVIRAALASGGLWAQEVDAVDGHGTGTTLGDPIEAQALLATYGQEREPSRPLLLGSVKSNLGHTQAAAGAAGVIKMVLALRHGELPKTLHAEQPSEHVDWSAGSVSLLTGAVPWPRGERPRRAGISSFGITGTNAHVILEEAPAGIAAAEQGGAGDEPADAEVALSPRALAWVLSAGDQVALRAQARRLSEHLRAHGSLRELDIAHSLIASRPLFGCRAVAVGAERAELLAGLRAIAEERPSPNAVVATPASRSPRFDGGQLVFLLPGQGAQRVGMGRELCERFPAFERELAQACAGFDGLLELPLRDALLGGDSSPSDAFDRTSFTQAAMFAFEVALCRLLEEWGLRPDYLIGHSVGELAAVHLAGALSLQDACRLVAARGTLMDALPAAGAMVSIQASERELLGDADALAEGVSVAAVNAPQAVVVSGQEPAVARLAAAWEARGRKTKRLRVAHAFHSACVEPILEQLREVAAQLDFGTPRIPVLSNVTAEPLSESQLRDPGYWAEHARTTVRFMGGVDWLARHGARRFLEIGPDGALSAMCQQTLECRAGEDAPIEAAFTVLPALRRDGSESRVLLSAVGQLFADGAAVDWRAALSLSGARLVELPTYPFQRRRHWLQTSPTAPAASVPGTGQSYRERLDAMRYRLRWQPAAALAEPIAESNGEVPPEGSRAPRPASALGGTWLVVLGARWRERPWTLAAVSALERAGVRTVPVEIDLSSAHELDRRSLAEQLRRADSRGEGASLASTSAVSSAVGVLSLLAAEEDADELRRGVSAGLAATLLLAQALEDAELPARLWLATRQGLATADGDRAPRPAQGLVWGMGRTLGWERPHRWGGLIDLPDELDERSGERLCAALAGGESQVAVRSSGVLVRRMLHAPLSSHLPSRGWRPRGTVLVTGGTGGIGGHVARWLAGRGAEHLLLASRRGEGAPGAKELAAELSAVGSRVSVAACDVGEREQLSGLLATVPGDLPLTAVFHAAGVSRGEWIRSLTPEQMERTLAPKVQAAVHLHELTEELDLDAFVLFSSLTSIFGSAKLGAYAAGNAFLDSLAEHRRARGLVATSISWSSWAGEGMAAEEAELSQRAGLGTMPPELTIQILAEALDRDEPHLIVADIDWARTAPMLELSHLGSLIRELPEARGGPFGGADDGTFLRRLAGLAPAERARETLELVRAELALVLGLGSGEEIPAQALFSELGLDSVSVVGLRARLQTSTGRQLPPTIVFDHPSVGELADHLLGLLDADAQAVDRGEPVGRP